MARALCRFSLPNNSTHVIGSKENTDDAAELIPINISIIPITPTIVINSENRRNFILDNQNFLLSLNLKTRQHVHKRRFGLKNGNICLASAATDHM